MKAFEQIEQISKDVFHILQDRTEYIGEPGLELVRESLQQPADKILHPLDTGSDIIQTLRETFERSSAVAYQGFDYLFNGGIYSNDGGQNTLKQRQRKAYNKAINQAVDRALKGTKKNKLAGPENADNLLQLTQVGPAIIRKLHAAGIYKFSQIANPTKHERKALAPFESRGAFTVWKEESQKMLAKRTH